MENSEFIGNTNFFDCLKVYDIPTTRELTNNTLCHFPIEFFLGRGVILLEREFFVNKTLGGF